MTKFKHRWGGGNSLELGCIIADNLTGLRKPPRQLSITELLEKYLGVLDTDIQAYPVDELPEQWWRPEEFPFCEQVDEYPCCVHRERGNVYMIGDKGVYRISESGISFYERSSFELSILSEATDWHTVRCSAFEIINKFI